MAEPVCPYCGAPPYDYPKLEDDWGRLMCADCFCDGYGRAEPGYWMEGVWVDPEAETPTPERPDLRDAFYEYLIG